MNRRVFLGSLGASMAVTRLLAEPDKAKGLSKAELPTPALLLDLAAFEANVAKMAAHCKQAGCRYRPHAKTHKCPEIAKRQVAAGALGVCVATLPEAEAMAQAGIPGILLTSPIADANKVGRLIALAKRGEVMASLGQFREAELLAAAASAAGLQLDVLIDLDVGDRRTGSLPGGPAFTLAQQIGKLKSLRLRGVQAYSGRSSHTVGFEQRRQASRQALAQASETRDLIRKAGFDAAIFSGGSTGTYNIDSDLLSELQVGSYVFMDVNYRLIGGQDGGKIYTDFQPSLTVLTTVVNDTHSDRVTVDAGVKAFSTDSPEKPEAKNWPGIVYARNGDEFGALTADGGKLPKFGDRLEFIIPHCDPTVNLYDRVYALRGDKVEDVWRILARRE